MRKATTVITPARYEQGLTYAEFMAQAKVNVDKFELYYRTSPLTTDDMAFFAEAATRPDGPAKILALAEAWCGDVYRELPTIARIAEAIGIKLRVFLRDEDPDIMDEFLSSAESPGRFRCSSSTPGTMATSPTSPSVPLARTPSWWRS